MIPHSKPLLDECDRTAVDRVIESGMLTGGETVHEFESAVCAYLNRRHGAAVSSGTAALYTVLRALGADRGGEIVVPSYVCSSLLHAVRLTGAALVLADSGDDPFHCDAASVGRVLSGKTKAVVFPHLFGAAVDIADIVALGVPVIEDCAMSLGSERCGTRSGSLGSVAAVLSFYTTKVIAAGEGGMVVSDDAELVQKVRDMADYADKVDGSLRFNFTMTDMAAALGLSQLDKIESFIDRRRMLARRYTDALADTGLILPAETPGERHIFYRYVVGTGDPEELRRRLAERGVRAERPVYAPLSRYPGVTAETPRAEEAWRTALSIPLYPALTDGEAESVLGAVKASIGAGRGLSPG